MTAVERDTQEPEDNPTLLQEMGLPFEVEDHLEEPFASFLVIHIYFAVPISSEVLDVLQEALSDWLVTHRPSNSANDIGEEPTGEVIQVGSQSVELQIHGAQGNPDAALPPLLLRLADLARIEPILRVDMD